MPDSNQLSRSWKIGWVALIVSAALISSRMAYMAPIILALSYPVAQMISISFVPNSKYPIIWLLHVLYWIIVLTFEISEKTVFIGMLGSSILGEILIQIIVSQALKWRWLLFNTCAMITIILSYKFVASIDKSYFQISPSLYIAAIFGLSALVSVQGIVLKSPESENKK